MHEPRADAAAARLSLAGRRAIVSGSAHGLGLGVATAFAGAGAEVACLDLDAEALAALAGLDGVVATEVADIADAGSVETATAAALEALGGLDVLVNCAAKFPVGGLAATPVETMVDAFDVNAAGGVRVLQAVLGALGASESGRVINFSSVVFHGGTPPEMGAYIASKAAVVGATRALARELGPAGITVNAIAPGAFPTRSEVATMGENNVEFEQQVLAMQSIKRRGEVEDIAATAIFLASDGAGFITGQTLVVDGGIHFA
jgi:NAD(P)-dependent dehydrogenase (short-subunit alcohol dehydrogenase family)